MAHARTSADLGDVADGSGDVDMLRAIGMVGRRHSVALDVCRLVDQGDRRAFRPAADGLLAVAVRLGLRDPYRAVENVLAALLDPLCKVCGGLAYERIDGSNELSARMCKGCDGTGKNDPGWGADERALNAWLDNEQGRAVAALSAKLQPG